MHEKDPYEYICMAQSYHDRELENSLKKPAQQMDEDALEKVHNKEVKKCGTDKLASKRPGHKWILMRRSWIMFAEAIHGANYRSPNAFDMYIWNDWEGYGMMEIVENFVSHCHALVYKPISATTNLLRHRSWTSERRFLRRINPIT